jgi:hypothetical protein
MIMYPFDWVQYGSTSGRAYFPNPQKNEGLFDESRSKNLHAKIDALSNTINQLTSARFAQTHFSHTYTR